MLGIATAIFAAGGPEANAAPAGRGFKGLGVNHVSYLCPDYTKARDFYSSTFGMQAQCESSAGRERLQRGRQRSKSRASCSSARAGRAWARAARRGLDAGRRGRDTLRF